MKKNLKTIIKNQWKEELAGFLINEISKSLKEGKQIDKINLDKNFFAMYLKNVNKIHC